MANRIPAGYDPGAETLLRLLDHLSREREGLAQALHDRAAQSLAAASLALSLLERDFADGGAAALARKARLLVAESSAELRLMQYQLHPPMLREFGLLDCLRALAQELSNVRAVRIVVDGSGVFDGLPASLTHWVYWIAQVALIAAAEAGSDTRMKLFEDGALYLHVDRGASAPAALGPIQAMVALLGGAARVDPQGALSVELPPVGRNRVEPST